MNFQNNLLGKFFFPGIWTCELESAGEKASAEVELSVAKEPEVDFLIVFVGFFVR